MNQTGVYAINCLISGKNYVGGAYKKLRVRCYDHWNALRKGFHRNRHLQSAWNKYGEEAFRFLVLELCGPDPVEVAERETYWISRLRASEREHGYNRSPTGGSTTGLKHSKESRVRHSEAARQRMTPEVRARIAESVSRAQKGRVGKSPGEGTRRKVSFIISSLWKDPVYRARMVAARRKRPPASAETRAKISAAVLGRKDTEETRQRKSEARQKLLAAGWRHSAESRARMSVSHRRRHAQDREAESKAPN